MNYRLVASPRATALRSIVTCLAVCALVGGCSKTNPGGTTGSGGNKGSGGATAAGGTTGSGGASATGGATGSGGGTAAGGATGSGGTGSGGSTGSGGATGSGGTIATGSGGTGSGGSTGSGGATGSGGSSSVSDGGTDAACQTANYKFAPLIPTVFVVVDQSGSEFTNATTGTFFTLRTAVLNVINQLQGQVRFGLGVFTGEQNQTPSKCPIWTTVSPALNNYTAINSVYSPLTQPQFKAETPAVQVLPLVQQALMSDTGTGAKYILFATDSETDFCDDSPADCAADAVTYLLQSLYSSTPSIGTLVIGLPDPGDNLAPAALQNFANAGAGQPIVFPTENGVQTQNQLYYECTGKGTNAGTDSWDNLYASAGKSAMTGNSGTAIATYGTTAGTATVYSPASTSETDLENQISAAISGVKSCTFDLSDVDGKSIKVDLTMLATASVKIEGKTIPQDATNGWSMSSSTELLLNGSACTTWQTPNNNDISFAFPCGSIIFE